MSETSRVVVRFATPEDVATLLRFIRELADYERLSDEMVADEPGLVAALFSANPVAEALIAELGNEPAGFALFFPTFSTFLGKPGLYLEDLYVRPDMRGRGIGRRLLERVAQLAFERGCGRLEWAVLRWNTPAIELYERLGATALAEWQTYRITGAALSRLAGKL